MKKSLYLFSALLVQTTLFSQTVEHCAMPNPTLDSIAPQVGTLDDCLTGYNYDTDGPIQIAICFHWFSDDACTDGIGTHNPPEIRSQLESFNKSERLVDELNGTFLSNNQVQTGDPNAEDPPPPIPFRFVLKSVDIHCDSWLRSTNRGSRTKITNIRNQKEYYLRPNCYNVFVTWCGRATGEAEDWGKGFSLIRPYDISDDPQEYNFWKVSVGNLWHEIGHSFNLYHSWANNNSSNFGDFCEDTPGQEVFRWEWDANCDGVIQNYTVNGETVKEFDIKGCWQENGDPDNPWSNYDDWNHNGIDDCQEDGEPGEACEAHPCCGPNPLSNNNFMNYSIDQSAATSDQIERMLEAVDNEFCDAVLSIGACAPPSAFLNFLPEEGVDDGRCSRCIYLEACYNEDSYRFTITETSSGSLIYDWGWITGEADVAFCYSARDVPLWQQQYIPNYLEPYTDYVAKIEVQNTCGVDEYEFPFNSGITECEATSPGGGATIDNFEGAPNPFSNFITLSYDVLLEGPVTIYRLGGGGTDFEVLQSGIIIGEGSYSQQYDASNWANGANSIFLEHHGFLYDISVMKIE